jgi:gamma-tubulin complex component 2
MDQADYMTHLMEMADEELRKDSKSANLRRLQSLLELSVRLGSAQLPETFKDDLRCSLASTSLVEQLIKIISVHVEDPSSFSFHTQLDRSSMTSSTATASLSGFEAFTLDLNVKWPLSLILNRKAIVKYQMLFRQLFQCKYIERLLNQVWFHLQQLKGQQPRSRLPVNTGPLAKTLLLRHRMHYFIRHMQSHLASQVIEQNWQYFLSRMSNTTTVDELLEFHTDFLDTCLKQGMLTNAKLLKLFGKLFHVCIVFTHYMDRFVRLFLVDGYEPSIGDRASHIRHTTLPHPSQIERLVADESFDRTITKFEENFTHHLRLLIDGLHFYSSADCEDHMLGLLCQLDYNFFFSIPTHRSASREDSSFANTSSSFNTVTDSL